MPLVSAYQMDPVHFAMVVIETTMVGTITPPVGLQLYIASSIGHVSIGAVTVWPFVIVCRLAVRLASRPAAQSNCVGGSEPGHSSRVQG
jgi:C4-dicarboxylate transporter DctM subunit